MYRILCVEDDKDSCKILEVILRQADPRFHVESVPTAEVAMELITAYPFDLYILDYWLPGMDGVELCKWIRQTDAHVPIVFLSGAAFPKDKQKALEAGANRYLTKPLGLEQLSEIVPTLLHSGPPRSAHAPRLPIPADKR